MSDTENKTQEVPDFSNEEMKMPETTMTQNTRYREPSVINGPLLAILAILLIIILGGMYYWFATMTANQAIAPSVRPTDEMNNEPESTTAEARTETTQAVSSSDELSAIEADLEATDLNAMDTQVQAIEAVLETEASTQP